MKKQQTKNTAEKPDRSEEAAANQNKKLHIMECKHCNKKLVEGGAILNDIRNYGMTGLFDQTDKTGQAYIMKSSGNLHQVLKCPECGYSVSEGASNDIQRSIKEGSEPCSSVSVNQATTGEELLKFFKSSPLQGAELDLDNRDKSTGRVAPFDD